MKVSRLPKDPGPAAWNAILPPGETFAALEETTTSDWLVIGAGFAGLSAARRLAQLCPTDRIVVLEAMRVADGPAGRNSGFMIDLPHDLASDDYGGQIKRDQTKTAMNRAAIAFAAEAAESYGMDKEAFVQKGKINAAASEKGMHHNKAYADHLTSMGEAFEVLDAATMREMTGISYYQGGLFTPHAAMIQPALYIRSLAHGVASNRLTIHENSPVVAFKKNGSVWQAQTPTGMVEAPKVILAVNGHAESFGFFKRQLMHVFTYASMTRRLTDSEVRDLGGERVWGFTPADPMGTTVRRISGIGGDRIVVRNRFTFDPKMEVNSARISSVARDHDRAFLARFPMLRDVEMEYRWGGRLCLSRNDVSAFGEVEDGLFSACCQNGLGTTRGTLSGMLAAELAAGYSSWMLHELQAEAAPRRLPPEPIASLGASAFIRWHEFKAGREM